MPMNCVRKKAEVHGIFERKLVIEAKNKMLVAFIRLH
jgi:hypothetical protein